MDKRYELLEKNNVDHAVLKQLADVNNELIELDARKSYLTTLLKQYHGYEKYLWRTKEGKVIAIPLLTDDHLKNIVIFLKQSDRDVPFQLELEYTKRFGREGLLALSNDGIEDGDVVENDYENGDLPF